MLIVGNQVSFMMSLRTKFCSGATTMSLKTMFQFLLTSNYSLDLRHQNHNLPPFFLFSPPESYFMLQYEHGKVESTTLEP